MAELRMTGIGKSYGEVEVLRNVNLEIEKGEFVVFVGPSGCGKSTLLRMIAGLERISAGTLEIEGTVVNDAPPAQRGIAMVFQSYALYPHMTVRDNMAFGMQIAKRPKAEIKTAVENAARILQLEPFLDRLPKQLSGGQRQRVAIGRAIVRNPKVFLFDEPLSNLDAALRVATRIEIAQLKEQMPESTMIYVTHDQVEAMTLANRIVVLNGGDIEQVGAPLELYQRPANEFVARFIGSPAMNLLPGKVSKSGFETEFHLDSGPMAQIPVASVPASVGAKVRVGVRPEDLGLADKESPLVEGRISVVEALGEVTLIHVAVPGAQEPVVAKLPGIHEFCAGGEVRLSASPEKLHVFDSTGISFRGLD